MGAVQDLGLRTRARAVVLFVALGVLCAGTGAYLVRLGLDQRAEAGTFAERAVEARARVVFATETKVLRNPAYTKAQVGFTTPGGGIGPTFAEVTDCPEARIDPDADHVDVLYDPADESDVRVPGCLGKSYMLSLVGGGGLLALGAVVLVAAAARRHG